MNTCKPLHLIVCWLLASISSVIELSAVHAQYETVM